MRKLRFLLLLLPFVFLGVAACDDSVNPAGPDQTAIAGHEAATAGPLSAARHGPKMVPYKADARFAPQSLVLTVCTLPPGYSGDPVALAQDNGGVGQHSHMGRTTSSITIAYCAVTATGVLGGGHFTHVAANGDSFSGLWDALFTPPTFEFVKNGKTQPLVFESGTGRFEGISGYAQGSGTINPVTGFGTFSVRGVISSVGS